MNHITRSVRIGEAETGTPGVRQALMVITKDDADLAFVNCPHEGESCFHHFSRKHEVKNLWTSWTTPKP